MYTCSYHLSLSLLHHTHTHTHTHIHTHTHTHHHRKLQIHQLPTELGLLTCLHSLLIDNLPLTDPPAPIPSLGTQTLLNYLHFKHMSSQPLNSMRVVVVGPEKAGKTSLINRLRGENVEEVLPTKGLEVCTVSLCVSILIWGG